MEMVANGLDGSGVLSTVNSGDFPGVPISPAPGGDSRQPPAGTAASPVPHSWGSKVWKRVFDFTFALLLLVVALPLLAVVALLVWATSPGPVIFRQVRAGRHGQPFVLCKFRTMKQNAERMLEEDPRLMQEFSEQWKLHNDPRVTRVGSWLRKTSIDELPQLINVLRGEMSIVGPRPVQPTELAEQYGEYAEIVFSEKPGLTGLWQVEGRSSISYEERVALDLKYVQVRSGWFDLMLVLRTVPAILLMRGAK
jgi:lipopolysaccharide/colanic/teichoic acid biosynthesis glycosyltransferase